MKFLFIISLTFCCIACKEETVIPPTEEDAIAAIYRSLYPKDFLTPSFIYPIDKLNILSIEKREDFRKTFLIKAVATGRFQSFEFPPHNLIDTIYLELKKGKGVWEKQKLKHNIELWTDYDGSRPIIWSGSDWIYADHCEARFIDEKELER